MLWPKEGERRVVVVAFFAPLLPPVAAALASNIDLTSLWSMSAWTLLPIVLLSSPSVKISPLNLQRIVAVASAEPLVMLIAAPVIAIAIFWFGDKAPSNDSQLLAAETERRWHAAHTTAIEVCRLRCRLCGDCLRDRPTRSLPVRLFRGSVGDQTYGDAHNWPPTAPLQSPVSAEELRQSGMALVCSDEAPNWLPGAAQQPGKTRLADGSTPKSRATF